MFNLFLVEHASQVQDLLSRGLRDKGNWISLGPSAMWSLDAEGISYRTIEEFYAVEELENLCLGTHERIEWLCNSLDEYLLELSPELREWEMYPFLFYIFPLTILFDGLIGRIFQLRAVLNTYPNHTVWVHTAPDCEWGAFDITFSNEETLWGRLLSLPGWDRNIEPVEESGRTDSYSSNFSEKLMNRNDVSGNFKEIIKKSLALSTVARNIQSRDWRGLLDLVRSKSKGSLLINNGVYEWSYTIPILRDKAWRILFANDRFFYSGTTNGKARQSGNIESVIEKNPELMACFESHGVSFYPLLKSRFSWILGSVPNQFQQIKLKVEETVKRYRIKGILTAMNTTGVGNAVNQAGRYLGLPVFTWQHGFVTHNRGRITQIREFVDLMTSDVVITFGREVKEAYQLYSDKFSSNALSIGSGSLDKIKSLSANSNQPVNRANHQFVTRRILYVTTGYCENTWYCGFSPPSDDRHFFRSQLLIMESLRDIVETPEYQAEATVKLHPTDSHRDPPWVDTFSKCKGFRIVKNSSSFVELLLASDIIIVDSPTTTALQTVATSKPLFVLMQHIGYPDSAKKMLEKRAICASNVPTLMEALNSYLRTDLYSADVDNNEFLKAYGNYLDDGKSAERAVEVIEDYI